MGLPKRLTDMQKRFAEYLVFGDPATGKPCSKGEAAKLAGYSPDRCRREGSELTNPKASPLVVQYIGELRTEVRQKHEVTLDKHLEQLDRIKEAALKKHSFSAAGNMEVARGKVGGLYVDRKEVRTGKLDDMTEEELSAKRRQILSDYAALLKMKVVEGEAVDVKEETIKSSVSSLPKPEESSSDHQK
jgi:phage terminase small subunit